jgi:hypothetical protein
VGELEEEIRVCVTRAQENNNNKIIIFNLK